MWIKTSSILAATIYPPLWSVQSAILYVYLRDFKKKIANFALLPGFYPPFFSTAL